MIKRIYYALCMMRRHYLALKAYNKAPELQISSVLALDPLHLKLTQGINAIVLDFDGVLAAYGDDRPKAELDSWLNSCVQIFGPGFVFILSNKPTEARKNYFNHHFQGIEFVVSRKKPYPDGIRQIARSIQRAPKELLVVDDRLLTGILAAIIAGASARYLNTPLINFSRRPVHELFFICLRKMERWILS
jgi:predicted HAD superfamily phosphohydrolase YqeG